jgi:hypothetical protein
MPPASDAYMPAHLTVRVIYLAAKPLVSAHHGVLLLRFPVYPIAIRHPSQLNSLGSIPVSRQNMLDVEFLRNLPRPFTIFSI